MKSDNQENQVFCIPALKLNIKVSKATDRLRTIRTLCKMLNNRVIECQRLTIENQRLSAELALKDDHELQAERLTNARLTDMLEAAEKRIAALEGARS